MTMDLRKLKTLIDLVSESNISELEITEADGKVRIVKADPSLKSIPVVILTTSNAAEEIVGSYGLGSLNQNLPEYVVLGTPTGDCCGGEWTHGGGYLGPEHAGVRLHPGAKEPLPFVTPSGGVQRDPFGVRRASRSSGLQFRCYTAKQGRSFFGWLKIAALSISSPFWF